MQTENSASKTKKWGLKLIRRGEKEKGSADKCSKRAEELISYKGNALFLKNSACEQRPCSTHYFPAMKETTHL